MSVMTSTTTGTNSEEELSEATTGLLPSGERSLVVVPEEKEDFFSRLPEEIIIAVLSRLETIEERVATSVLSRRWRSLWKHSNSTSLFFMQADSSETRKFVDRVNRIILALGREDCMCTTTIDYFGLYFNMTCADDVKYQSDIDGWLSFALQRNVKSLWLNCNCDCQNPIKSDSCYSNHYSLTNSQLLGGSSSRNPTMVLDSLTYLSLHGVDVTGELLENILSVSPLLEELSVSDPGPSLVNFTVSGPSLKLKHLEVWGCFELKRLNIHDLNHLESLSYSGDAECLIIKDTPLLVDATTSFYSGDTNMEEFAQMLSKLARLETLDLVLSSWLSEQQQLQSHQFPKLRNLKRLELTFFTCTSCSWLCAALLDASPTLRELNIQLPSLEDSSNEDEVSALSHPHGSLKMLKVFGFIGCQLDKALLNYLVENITSLEKITVVTRIRFVEPRKKDPEKQQEARVVATTLLEKIVTPGTEFSVD